MARKRRIKRRNASVPIASMGDIAFLLIIFFLILSEFNQDKPLDLTLPNSELIEKNEHPPIARVSIDENGIIYFNNNKIEDSKAIEFLLTPLIKTTVSDEQRLVRFKCDQHLDKDTFEPVLQAIAEAGGIIEAVGELEGN